MRTLYETIPPVVSSAATRTQMKRMTENDTLQGVEVRLRKALLAGLDGDAAAYRAFLDELSGHLRAFLRKRLFQAQHDIEDIVQETLLAVHNGRHTYRPDQPLTAWVYAIARYKLMDFLRARSRHDALNDPLDDELEIFAASDRQQTDARIDIEKLLVRLPDRQRLPILHVKLEGLSIQEAAQLTGMSESAVKVGIHRGLKALAAMFQDAS